MPFFQAFLTVYLGVGLLMEIVGLTAHSKSLKSARSEGAASFYLQTTLYGKGEPVYTSFKWIKNPY